MVLDIGSELSWHHCNKTPPRQPLSAPKSPLPTAQSPVPLPPAGPGHGTSPSPSHATPISSVTCFSPTRTCHLSNVIWPPKLSGSTDPTLYNKSKRSLQQVVKLNVLPPEYYCMTFEARAVERDECRYFRGVVDAIPEIDQLLLCEIKKWRIKQQRSLLKSICTALPFKLSKMITI